MTDQPSTQERAAGRFVILLEWHNERCGGDFAICPTPMCVKARETVTPLSDQPSTQESTPESEDGWGYDMEPDTLEPTTQEAEKALAILGDFIDGVVIERAQLNDRIEALQLQHTIDLDEIRALRRGRDGEGSPRNRAVR